MNKAKMQSGTYTDYVLETQYMLVKALESYFAGYPQSKPVIFTFHACGQITMRPHVPELAVTLSILSNDHGSRLNAGWDMPYGQTVVAGALAQLVDESRGAFTLRDRIVYSSVKAGPHRPTRIASAWTLYPKVGRC